ncbi:MAG TPA: hypothetical protein VFS56_01705 [Gemmatimonadaceae bacterium]|nr:hypothetical protein [Gemmatimonadaceae bacterium]
MTVELGMCGFTIGAKAYYKQFRVVEVQQTFYDPPSGAQPRRSPLKRQRPLLA